MHGPSTAAWNDSFMYRPLVDGCSSTSTGRIGGTIS